MLEQPQYDSALEFCRQNELMLEAEGEELLTPQLSTRDYFRLLMSKGCMLDARRIVAHVLPKRHALWWGLLCTWEAIGSSARENVREVLGGVGRFIVDPSEALLRRDLEELAELVRPQTGAYCLAMAAVLSGPATSDADLPICVPMPFLTGRFVGVAVYLASVAREPLKYKQRLERYISLGLELSREPQPWLQTISPAALEAIGTIGDASTLLVGARA